RVEPHGGSGAERLGNDPAASLHLYRARVGQQMADVLTAVADPVGYEQELAMLGDRAFPAGHDVDPRRVAWLDPELGVGDVLASAPGDAVVDDQLLAVIAQVDAPADDRP